MRVMFELEAWVFCVGTLSLWFVSCWVVVGGSKVEQGFGRQVLEGKLDFYIEILLCPSFLLNWLLSFCSAFRCRR